jgi:hypothetical protein
MIGKQKEKWMELCELAANEQDANKLMALITEINHLLEIKRQHQIVQIPTPFKSS